MKKFFLLLMMILIVISIVPAMDLSGGIEPEIVFASAAECEVVENVIQLNYSIFPAFSAVFAETHNFIFAEVEQAVSNGMVLWSVFNILLPDGGFAVRLKYPLSTSGNGRETKI